MAVTKYCPNCGLERVEGQRFCRNCGHALGTGETKLHESRVSVTAPLEGGPVAPAPVGAAAPAAGPAAVVGPTAPAPEARSGLPPPPSAPHPVVAGPKAAVRVPPFKPLALAGGLALVVAAFLPWISGGLSVSAMDLPLEAVWNIDAQDGAVKLGFAFLALGGLGAGLSFVARSAKIRRVAGSIALALVLGFALQLYRSVDLAGGSVGDVVTAIGIGVYVALSGAICLQLSK